LVLFPSSKTCVALTERALGHLIYKYAAHARLADLSPHDLRHRFGYRMAEVVPLHRLAQIMGHDSLDTTLRYVQGTQQDIQNEIEKMIVSSSLRGFAAIMFGIIADDDHMKDDQTAEFVGKRANLIRFGAKLPKEAFEQIS
jgi:hypothetical protein